MSKLTEVEEWHRYWSGMITQLAIMIVVLIIGIIISFVGIIDNALAIIFIPTLLLLLLGVMILFCDYKKAKRRDEINEK